MDWKRKLGSRKFWSLVAGFAMSVLILTNADSTQIDRTASMIMAFGSIVVYMLSESYIDAKAIKKGEE